MMCWTMLISISRRLRNSTLESRIWVPTPLSFEGIDLESICIGVYLDTTVLRSRVQIAHRLRRTLRARMSMYLSQYTLQSPLAGLLFENSQRIHKVVHSQPVNYRPSRAGS